MQEEINEAISIVKQGGVVIFPTDTAFGIGCRMDDADAVQRLFTLRKRPENQATPVLVNSVTMAREYLKAIPDAVNDRLLEVYWPGALTVILPCDTARVPALVRGGGDTLGIRMPNHPTTLSLLAGVDVPLLGPSANFHGAKTPYEFTDLDQELVKLVDFVMPGECIIKQASTVIDCSVIPWKVLRKGAVALPAKLL